MRDHPCMLNLWRKGSQGFGQWVNLKVITVKCPNMEITMFSLKSQIIERTKFQYLCKQLIKINNKKEEEDKLMRIYQLWPQESYRRSNHHP